MRWLIALFLSLVISAAVSAQTETPEPTATYTPAPHVFLTIPPLESTPSGGQLVRLDYVVTAGDVHNANLLTALLFSVWGMFIFTILVKWIGGQKK